MSLTNYVIMPGSDYQEICDTVRSKNGETGVYKSGELAAAIERIADGAGEISLSSIEVYVADYSVPEDVLITVGSVDVWKRTLVS